MSQTDIESDVDAKPDSYYPTLEQVIACGPRKNEKHLKKLNKENYRWLIRDLESQLKKMLKTLNCFTTEWIPWQVHVSSYCWSSEGKSASDNPRSSYTGNNCPNIKPTCPSNAHLQQVRISGKPENTWSAEERNKLQKSITVDISA